MSYGSVASILAERGINLDTASNAELQLCLIEAFKRDLSEAFAWLTQLVADFRSGGDPRLLRSEDPNSSLGKQLIRLIGTDIARQVCQQHFGIQFAIYNCCKVVVADSRDALQLSMREQIAEQVTPDC